MGEEGQEEQNEQEAVLSKRQRRRMSRMTVSELKQVVTRPEVVETWDTTSRDPVLLVYLKSYRNTVPVPAQKMPHNRSARGFASRPMSSDYRQFMVKSSHRAFEVVARLAEC